MPYGVVSGVGRGIGDGCGSCRRGSGSFGLNLGHPIELMGILLCFSSQITLGTICYWCKTTLGQSYYLCVCHKPALS